MHLDDKEIQNYHIFHDCGKPYCLEIDNEGRRHFPNHADISFNIAQNFLSDRVCTLIKNDMKAHLTKPSAFEEFILLPDYKLLLITALCEIHSNAKMFGGIDSTSFKIKFKNLNKLAKRCLIHNGDK